MRFARAKFCLNPVSLANGILTVFWAVGGGHVAEDVVKKMADRIDLELLYSF